MLQRTFATEIPLRMDRLSVSEDDDLNMVLRDLSYDPFDNIPINYLSSTSASPSPDELIIRQRGRRRTSILWSPEKIRDSLTPVRSVMTLRSSPRKRLLASDITPISPDESETTPRKSLFNQLKPTFTGGKRLKFDEKPIAQTNTDVPLTETLKGYSQDQLIAIIGGLVEKQPELEQKIRTELPAPDIRQMEQQLCIANKNIYKSLPTSRLAKKTDGVSYNRAVTHLNILKKTIMDHTNALNISKNWDSLFDYTRMAWTYVRSTPIWDNNSHNTCRRSCFKILSNHLYVSLKRGGLLLGEHRILDLSNRIENMCDEFNDSQINLSKELLNDMINSSE